ncbi:hypothetical protein A0J48_017105 [Sphaerospermopsis aphanizomenoides BCCUSP55]|uniref:hypothetical protein n=1 Tax=Sphaerospermopsis aphanizomenoides TaxID=459663 RepID=UPI001902DCA3|nr:hypothetical protein [Sphaerospermopsis aphanizomenoides]MBK1989234.1 hypothetical protein [Sphaerospermopsis aphanizomenoides BCCUSP55]
MQAFYEIFNVVMQKHKIFNTENTIKVLELIQDFKFDKDHLPSGGGFKAQEKVAEMLESQLKKAVRDEFVGMISE